MRKEEIREYVSKNYELPENAGTDFLSDIQFCIELLEIEPQIINSLPEKTIKEVLLADSKYLSEVFPIAPILEDEEFAEELIGNNNDLLLELKGESIKSEYIKNLSIQYLTGNKEPMKGSRLAKLNLERFYRYTIEEVKTDYDISIFLLEKDIRFLSLIKVEEIKNNPKYIIEYLKEYPGMFPKYIDKIEESLTPELIESVLEHDLQNYTLINPDNPLMSTFYSSLDRIKEIRPELKMDNPNMRYELLCMPEFVDMDINIINSLLEYNTGNVDKVIEIAKSGNIQYLTKYIEQYGNLYGKSLENIQEAISSYESMEELLISTNDNLSIDEGKLKTIIATKNKFGFVNEEDLLNYDEIVKEYYANKLEKAKTKIEVLEIYSQMLFNSSTQEYENFFKEYCNYSYEELEEYAESNGLKSPLGKNFKKRQKFYEQIQEIEDVEELKEYFDTMPLEICDIKETKSKIEQLYSQGYSNEMLDLNDESLTHQEYNGVDVINLNGQEFKLCIHRIFNFDFNMNSITHEILNNPDMWNLLEGSNSISTTLITDKKIAGLFRSLRKSNGTEVMMFDSKEKSEEHMKKQIEKSRKIHDGEILKEIDPDAVFYGFTSTASNGIMKMDSSDMMVEHGKGHLGTKASHFKMRNAEDLAYWTSSDYWNEVVQKRKETNIEKAQELREKNGTDRITPSCIVCFDGNINEKSLLAARTHNIPILMIDRQLYADINKQKLKDAKQEFEETLNPSCLDEIFYRQQYYDIVEEMPRLIETIRSNETETRENKQATLEYLAYLGQHFIEQAGEEGYIIDVPVNEYNEKMKEYVKEIDEELAEKDLVTMADMEQAYKTTSAVDRKKRYDILKQDINRAKENKRDERNGSEMFE